MADEEYNKKLESLQQYIPFLNNMIAQLKDPRKKNREQQLAKMVSLHSMITDKKKKLKLETLTKCEDVILKLYEKVKSGSHSQAPPPTFLRPPSTSTQPPITPSQAPITPSSPSPPRDILKTQPVVIPTEKISDRYERDSKISQPSSSHHKPIIDIYSSAADSLIKTTLPPQQKSSVFDRLGRRGPELSKPPISMEDLEALQQDVLTEGMSLNELTDLRAQLQKQLTTSDDAGTNQNLSINTTVRNTTILTKKAVEKAALEKCKPMENKSVVKTSPVPSIPVKVVKESSSIFGSTLSSIDKVIIEVKSKEKERRNSIGSKKESSDTEKKERRSSKDETKSDGHRSSKDRDKNVERLSPKDDKRSDSRRSSKDRDKDKTEKKSTEHKSKKDDSRKDKSKDRKDDATRRHDKDRKKDEARKSDKDKAKEDFRKDKDKLKDEKKRDSPKEILNELPSRSGEEQPKEQQKTTEPPVYKRLADKYNPKPRKPQPDNADVTKKVSEIIESNMRSTPIPFLELLQKSPTKTQLPSIAALSSPASSTGTLDNEVANFNRKPLISHPPQPVPAPLSSTPIPPLMGSNATLQSIPAHVSNILSNPNTTALINSVVNQFKGGRQTPICPPTPNAYAHPNVPTPNQTNFQNNNYAPNQQINNQAGGFWPNQQHHPHHHGHAPPNHPHPQNFQPRSFTPAPTNHNQYDQMQSIDYYPPSATPSHNFNHQIPPLLSPQYDNNYEQRSQRPPNEETFNKNYRDDWRRFPSNSNQRPPSQARDPRIHRDPRFRDDPRNATTTQRRDSREYDRDDRSKFRDPRLNRFRYERERDQREREPREREREQARVTKPRRESEENSTFASPLDSLYSGSEGYRKTGKGYGMQNFKIPKIKKDEEVVEKKEVEVEEQAEDVDEKKEAKVENDDEKPVLKEKQNTEETREEVKVVAEPEPKKTELKPSTSAEVNENEENVASTSVSSSTESDVKDTNESQSEVSKEVPEIGEISSTNDIADSQPRDTPKPLDDEGQTDIINKFLKKLLENERTRAAASLFIDNVSNSLDDEKLKMVVQTVKSATVDEEPEQQPVIKEKKLVRKKINAKLVSKKKQVRKRLTLRRRKKKPVTVISNEEEDETNEEEEEEEEEEEDEVKEEEVKQEKGEEEEVVVSVGERIKSRKRRAASPRKKGRHKTELDLLHEDIQDMFIRDGVLTATGKRMCRLLKTDNEPKVPVLPEPKRRTRNSAEKFDSKTNSDKLKAMSNVRVLIPKISADQLAEIDEESQRYSLRRANKSAKSYAEVDSEDEREKEKEKQRQLEREKEEEEEREREREEEKRLAKEKEEAEKAAREQEEKEKEKEKGKITPPKKVKKRGNAWASGVLPKTKKKKPIEEKDRSFEFVEPDRNYFSSKLYNAKSVCKLCDYDGINISKHYRAQHPDFEVLSSRLSPQKAEEAIKIANELKLDEKEEERLWTSKLYKFQCRFCDYEMHCQPSNFYDHIATHTGEYRHVCAFCSFCGNNPKSMRSHYKNSHGKDTFTKAVCIRRRVYGYICIECNFVQTIKKTVENHVNVYHLGEGKKILKIHLSTLDDEVVRKEKEKLQDDTTTGENVEEPKAKKKKPNKKVEVARCEESPKPIKKEKEIDMTVFTCNTNIQEENQKIQQERLQKMTELAESVNTKRQSLNFVDQLSNRLLQEQRESPSPEHVSVKNEPIDDELPELEPQVEVDTSEPEMSFAEPILELTPKRPAKVTEPVAAASSVEVVEKDTSIIQGMIQKLQGILKEEKNDGPPPLAPLIGKAEEGKAFISAGFLNISKTGNGLEYACRVPSCLFTSTNRDSFVLHWKEDHTRINQSYKMTKCRICNQEVKATLDCTLLLTFFAHVENEHLCGIRTSFNAGLISIDKDREGFQYICRVSMCIFITKNRESFVLHLMEHNTMVEMCKSTKCGICQAQISATAEADLLTTLFAHIETEHLEDDKTPKINLLRTRRLSGDKLSSAKEESPELKESEENPFPFKISGVMSLADESVPPLSPLRDKPATKVESVILKEAKMTNVEKAVTWKCAEAVKKFLQCPRELYKCPQFFCKYATSWRHLFEGHIKAHARVNDELVSCVYCDVKTPLSHSGLHIDLRHSNCLYSCSQCLYRALTREYVLIHNRLKHKEGDLVVALPPKIAKTIMMSKQKLYAVKDACQPYRCGYQGCNAQFLFLNEFCDHLQKFHDGIMMCGYLNSNQQRCNFQCLVVDNMIDHWRTHACYHYHCLLCKVGTMETYTMLEHYSLTHPNMEPMVVDRRNSPAGTHVYAYSDEAVNKIRFIKEELLESINLQHVTIVDSQETEPPKNVTLLPLSVFQQSNPTEAKKIIAIIPNTKIISPSAAISIPTPTVSTTFTTPASKPSPSTSTPFIFASTEESTVTEDKEDKPKEVEGVETENVSDNSADPLCLDGEILTVTTSGDEGDYPELNESGDMKSFGLIGYQLYRCSFCDISFSNSRDFKAHTTHSKQCRDPANVIKPYKCVHCQKLFKIPHGLLEHIQYHGQLRFGCSLCVQKFPSSFSLKVHMRGKHNIINTITTPVVPNKTNQDRDEFILRPVPTSGGEGGNEGAKTLSVYGQKRSYGPDELDQLPKRYIFNADVKCALCPYITKVRTNLVRHLQFHSAEKSVPDIAPVNPVPCLDKNEKMFDKMTNLAISSFSGSSGSRMGGPKPETKVIKEEHPQIPAYVPAHRRYVCCAKDCNYLCLEEGNLRHHLHALHDQEPSFTCSHCKMNLKTDVEGFLKHLKLHDLHLYKCSGCTFVHHLRHKVDKHAADKHSEVPAHTITIRALDAELPDSEQSGAPPAPPPVATDTPSAPTIKWTKPWHCGMCKYRCAAKSDILTHIFNKHDINTQFKCTLCSYKTDEKPTFDGHFKENHPDNEIDIIYVYYKSEGAGQQSATNQKQFDTTPLWQRDRPRIRHIRGILFEESSASPPKMKKTAAMGRNVSATSPHSTSTSSTFTNLDLAIDAVAKGMEELATTMMKREPIVPKVDVASEIIENPDVVKPIENRDAGEDAVIVIDDDDEELDVACDMMDVSKLDESNDNLMIDDAGGGDVPEVKNELSKEFLSDDILYERYGKLCMPQANAFKCPMCKYRNKKVASFVHHVLTELKCYRFKCNSCDYVSVTIDGMIVHCQSKHESMSLSDTPIDKTVEYWLQNLIKYQSKFIVQQAPPSGGESKSAAAKIPCMHCQKWFKSPYALQEHELHHWADHSYQCEHCCSNFQTLNELFQHSFLTHANYDLNFTCSGPYVGSVIAALKPPQVRASPSAMPPLEDKKYECLYCSESGRTLEMLKTHVEECHEGEEFRYKVAPTAKTKVDFHSCGYCHERGSEEFVINHHKEKHGGRELNMYQYICLECSGTCSNLKELRGHFSSAHAGKKLTYSCIENKPGGSKDYVCTKCPFRSGILGVMRSHLKKHLRPVECLTCGATFIYPTEARAHHNKEHSHITPEKVEENKEKIKEYEDLVQKIVATSKERPPDIPPPPPQASISTPAPTPRKMLARKSTGAPFIREYSFYGQKKEDTDLSKVSTSIE